ncbi:uncharacterized protein LOC127718205 isoform X2 [Mytilus californianus]|uniref:uncharacterized protein LOC127718205 isoform X2 n=1 Tax=Mytilus californianus TaxID=6549 RepID=UPI00224578DA|nr:uncharacterized protein LOC127718205 isoform X2 [Mytilus californianus]
MEEYDPADPTEEGGHGAAAAAASKGEEDRQTEDRPEGPSKSEAPEKPEINLADFPTQFGKPAKKRSDKSYFHEGMADLPSRYDDEEEEGSRRRWRREGDSDDEKRFEEEYDNDVDRRYGRGRGRGGRFGRPPRRFEDEDEFGRDGPPRIEDNPFRRLEQDGPGRPPPGIRDRPPPRDRYSRDDDRPPYDDDPRYDHRRFRRSPPPFDDRDDRHPRFRRDGPPYDGPPYDGPPYDRPPYDDDRYDRPPRFGPPRYERDGPPMYDRDGPPPPQYDDDRHHYDRFHFHRDRPPRYGPPPRPDSPDFGPPMHPGPPPPRPRGGLLPTPPPPSQQPSEPQYPPPPPEHPGMPFPGPEGPPRFGPPPPGPPPPPMGPPPFQGPPMPFQGPPGFPAPPQHMPPGGPMPGMPPPGPEMPPMSAEQQYYGPPPPMMPPQGDPQWNQQMMAPPMQGMPPPPPPQFPPPPPPMDPQMAFPPMDPQMMQPPMMPPQPPMSQPQQYYEQAPPPQMMVFPPPPPPPEPVEIPEPKPELIPIPPPPAEEEHKSDDMEIDNTEMPDIPTVPEKPPEEEYKMMYSAEPTVPVSIEAPVSSATIVSAPVSYSAPPTYSAAPALAPVQKIFEPPKFAAAPTMADSRPPPPPPPMVVFPTHIYSAPQPTQVSEEDKSVAQKAAEDLIMMTQPSPQPVTMPIVHPVVQPEPEPVVQDQPRGFVPVPTVESEPVKEPVSFQKEEPEPEPMEREATPEKQSGDPIKTTAQQLLERIKQKQLKAQASSLQAGGSNPLVKSARRFFNPVAMVAGSKIQFAMASAKKNVTSDNPLKSQEEDADKKKKGKEGKKEMFRPGLDGEETLSSIMQKYQQHQKFIEQINKNKEGDAESSEAPSADAINVNGTSSEVKVPEEIESTDKVNEEQMEEDPADSKAKRSRFADMTEEERLFVKEKEIEGSEETEEKKRDASPEKKKEDDKSYKSKRSPSPEEDDSKSRRRRSSPSPRDKQRSRSPDHSRDRRDRRSRSRSHEDRYSSRKSRRSPSPRRRDYDDRQRFRYGDFRRENDFRRGDRGGSPYGRGSRNRRQDLSPRSDYRSRQRDRSPSPRSRGYKGQQSDRSSSPRSNYRRTKERSPSPMQTNLKSQQREYSPSPRRSSLREKSPDESDHREKHRDASPKTADYRSSKTREASPPQRQPENLMSRQRDRSPPEYRSTKQRDRTPPSPEYRSSKQREPSPSPRQMEYRSSKQHDLSPDLRSVDYRSSKQKERSPSPEVAKPKPRERSVSPRSSRYPQKRRSPSPKMVEKPRAIPSPRTRASPDARRASRPVHEEKRTRKESSSSSSSSSDSSSSDESESDKSLETPEDERIKKEKREKLLMELKSIEESLEKQRTMKKKGKGGKENVRTEDRERSEDRQSYRSSRSEEERKQENRYDPRQRREEESHPRMPPEMVERAYEDRTKQEIPDVYLKSIEKYQKEFKSRQNDEPSKMNQREEYEQPYKPEEKGTRERREREARSEYSEPEYEGERRSASVKRGSGDERGRHEERRYLGEPQTMYEDDRKREQVDPRIRTEKRRPDPRIEKEESSDEEVVKPKQEPVRDRRRDSGSKYSDRSPDDPRYDDRREVPKEKYKPERSESRRFTEKPREFEGSFAEKKRDPAYQGYEDFPDKTRSEYERRPPAEYGERRSTEYSDRGPVEYEERRPVDYENRRPDSGSRYEEKSKTRNEYNEGDRKRDWVELPTEYEESPRKKERLDRPSRTSEYESYEGYHPESRSTSEKSYKIDPVDELDYYLNRKPKAAQGQVEKNGKWQTEPDQSPPDIRQSYYSPIPVEKEEEDRYDKKAKKKKKHRSRSPVSRDSKKKSKRSKRSPSEEESDDPGRYRRSNRSPVVEEFERRRSPSPRYRRTSSPEDQPYNNRAERYWRPPDHKLDEIHHYTDKKHKSASMTKDFPELLEIEKATRKSDNANTKEEKERKSSYGDNIDKERFTEADPLRKREPDDPPVRPSDTSLMERTTESKTIDAFEISTDKTIRKRPKIKRLPVPDTPPSDKSNHSDSQSESSYISDGEKSAYSEQKIDQKLSDRKITKEKVPEEPSIPLDQRTEKSSSVKAKSEEIKTDDTDKIHGLSSFMNIYEDSDDSRSSAKNSTEIRDSKEKVFNTSTSSLNSSIVDIKMNLTENESAQLGSTAKNEATGGGIVDTEDLRRSIIADYSDSDDNTNASLRDNVTDIDTTQNLADHDFVNVASKMADEKIKTTIESETRDRFEQVQDYSEVSAASNVGQSSEKDDNQQAIASKSDPSNDAIKLQYKRTRYGIRLRSKELDNKDKTDVKFDHKVNESTAVKYSDSVEVGTRSFDEVTSETNQMSKQDDRRLERSPRKNEQKRYLPESASQSLRTDTTRPETDERDRRDTSYSSESDKRKEKSARPRSYERSRRWSHSPDDDRYRKTRRNESPEVSPERQSRRSRRKKKSSRHEYSPDRHISEKGDRRSREREQTYRSSLERHSLDREHSKIHTDKKETAELSPARRTKFETSIELQSSEEIEPSTDVNFKKETSQVKEGTYDPGGARIIDKLKQTYKDDTEDKMLETKEMKKTQSTKLLEESQQSGTSRWSLRSKASDSQDDSPRCTAKEDSPKPSTMTERSRKSEDDDAQREATEEKQAAKRRTRSSRSSDDLVDQKTPDISIERQLSKRHKKSRKGDEISIENDPKLNSTLSVDLSSIALPGEGIRIKIFSEALSPTGNRKSPKASPIKKTHADSLTDLKLEEIVLPGEILRQEKSSYSENLNVSSEVKIAEDVKASTEIQQERQNTIMPVQPPRKEYPIRSQQKGATPLLQMQQKTAFSFHSKKLPEDKRPLVKFGLPKSSNPSKLWEDEEDVDFTDKLLGKKIVDEPCDTSAPEEATTVEITPPQMPEDRTSPEKSVEKLTIEKEEKKEKSVTPEKSVVMKADDSFIKKADDSFTRKADDSFTKKANDSFTGKADDSFISTSSDDPDISFKTPSLVIKSKPVERKVDSPERALLIVGEAPETPVISRWNKTEEKDKAVEKPVESIDATTTKVQISSDTGKQEKSSRRSKSRWDPPVAEPVAVDLYDPLQPTADDLYDPFMPTDDETLEKSKSFKPQEDDQVTQNVASSSSVDLYDPTQPTDLDAHGKKSLEITEVKVTMANSETKVQQEEVAEKSQASVEKKSDDEHLTHELKHEVIIETQPRTDKVPDEQELHPESSSIPSKEKAAPNSLESHETEPASPKPFTSELKIEKTHDSQREEVKETSSDSMPVQSSSDIDGKPLGEDSLEMTEAEYIAKQILKMSKTAQMPRVESVSMVTKVSESKNENNEKLEKKLEETGGMIEIAPEDISPTTETKSVLLTSKLLQLPSAEKIADKKSLKKDSTEEGEILSEADDKRDLDIGMAIETVVYGKGQKQGKKLVEVVKVKEEPDNSEGQGQVIESIITTRGKPKIEHVIAVAKGKEEKAEKAAVSEDTEDKVRKAQTEEALKLLEQFKGIDTKNEEALKMIEKFRSVDKELKTYNLDKPRSKKESWERESYKERYEESKYRESSKYKDKDYKDKDYGRYSKDKDYEDRYSKERHDDRYKSFDKRRDKFWDKRRRDSSERFEKYERKRHKKERYHDRRDRSYSRSHSRSPDRSKSRNSRSRSRDRSKEQSRRRSRERSRSRDRSRSQDRGRKSKRSRRDKRRYSSDESDDSMSSSRSARKEKEAYLDSSKGEVDKLTEEWIRMATEKPKKTKGQSSAAVSSTASTSTMSSTTVTSQSGTAPPYYQATTAQTGAPPQYYQDAYGNYYPVTSTSQGYPGYQGMPPPPQQGHEQNIPGMVPPHQTALPQGMPQQPIPAPGMPPPGMTAPGIQGQPMTTPGMPPQHTAMSHSMPPPGHMMPPHGIPEQAPVMSQYQQPNPQMYGQQQGYGQSEQLYDQSMYGHQPQPGPLAQSSASHQGPLGNQPPIFQAAGLHPTGPQPTPLLQPPGLLPTPAAQFGLQPEYSTPGLIQPQHPPLIGPAIVQPVASTKLPFAGSLQGTRLPFPMPTQQNIPTFKPMEQKQSPLPASPLEAGQSPSQLARPKQMAVLQQKLLVTASPQDVSLSPSQLSRTDSPVVTSSSKDYQLPELPYQEAIQEEIKVEEVKPAEIKPLSKPQMAMKGFKIKQKGLSLVMPTEDVVSSSFQSDTEEKSKKLSELSETENATPSPVTDLPKHPPPSSKTGLPIKLGMKQDKKDADLSSPPPSASPRPEKVKSRWRRLSDFETPITQSPDSNMTDVPASSGSEASPMKEPGTSDVAQVKQAVYDAWDPASDLIITPEAMKPQPTFKAKKETTQKRDKKEKAKDTDSPLKTEKVKETDSPLKVKETKEPEEEADPNQPPTFELLDENLYLSEKKKSKKMKRMLCDCTITDEEKKCNVDACGEDCLNRMLYIECGSRCQCGDFCTNKRFQKRQFADVAAFRTDWKGFGLKTNAELPHGDFVMEYVGEVLDYKTFKSRTKQYAKSGESHFYFMALNADEVIDASYKGNVSRFINHSCDPNCETQKWTVNGVLRVGFFTKKEIPAGTELTFDYQFETYGKEAQKCFCGTEKCRGTIGINKSTPLKTKKKPAEQEEDKKASEELFQEEDIEEELDLLSEQGLHNKTDVLNLCRLMVRSEETQFRIKILKIIQECSDRNCLRLFLDYHGLELLWTWMADKTEECQELKVQILTILKDLPINTKNMLKDSKILSLVQRWAGREEGEELQPCQSVPPPPVPKEMPISILASSKETRQLKKRVRFPDEASSDDNESRTSTSDNFSEYTTNELYTDFEGKTGAGNDQVSEAEAVEGHQSSDIDSTSDDSKSREQPVQSPADSSTSTGDVESVAADSSSALEEIKYIEPRPDPMDEVAILADELLVNWSDLKELFRIPKKQQVEERKRHEKELDKSDVTVKNEKRIEQMERVQDRFRHLAAGWDTRKKKKRPPPPPPPEDDEFTDRPRKVLLPTPPKISKEERRQIFEAQVKAQEEMAEIERQQREAYLQQFYSDPNNYMYYGQDPNCPLPQGFQVQPGVEGGMEQYIDPNTGQAIPYEVIQAYIAQQQALQQPQQAGYTDEALQQQLMSQQVQEQMLAQQALAGYAQPTPEMLYQQPEQASGESQAFIQQVQQLQQQLEMQGQLAGMGTSEEEDIPPPPSPPKSKAPKLPPNWKSAKDAEGKTYYYHTTTRQTQWSPPDWEEDDDMSVIQDDMDFDTPPDDIKSGRKKTTTAAADTSTETAKKIKDQFRQKMSSYIVICLNPYRKPDCKSGRITSTDDFKHLARKLTHHVMSKELKHCRHVEDLEVNENVKAKAKDYVKKYMGKFGMIYRKSASPDD